MDEPTPRPRPDRPPAPRVRHEPGHPIDTCATCRFYRPTDGEPSGECRRHAPQRMLDDPAGVWPLTGCLQWCGKYEPRHPADTHPT